MNLSIPKSSSWEMFDRISGNYDFLNHFLSFGLDRSWRKCLSKKLPSQPNQTVLDLATGTGDVLLNLIRYNKNVHECYGIDLADKMLAIGRKKTAKAGLDNRISFQHGDANHIPFQNNNFDAVTIAFGIRNVENPVNVLQEMRRVLKPAGRALILEFSLPQNPIIRRLHLFYLRNVVPWVGGIFSGDAQAYRYLNQTIEEFPFGADFCRLLEQTGFKNIKVNPLLLGVATIYTGDK